MPNPTAADIEKLCDEWSTGVQAPDSGFIVGLEVERFRLMANGVVFHELDHETLCAAVVGLSKVLLSTGRNSIGNHDHSFLWAWCAELLLVQPSYDFTDTELEIKDLFSTCIHAALAHCREPRPEETKEEFFERHRLEPPQPHHAKQLIDRSNLVVAYLAFPLLEAVLKRACKQYVDYDGKVISAFTVPGRPGKRDKLYGPIGTPGQNVKGECSSLRDLLFLHHTAVAGPRLCTHVDSFRAHLTMHDASRDPFELIYTWRNQSLHGSASFLSIGGAVLNLSLLISIFELENEFEKHRATILQISQFLTQSPGSRSPWSFYPPY